MNMQIRAQQVAEQLEGTAGNLSEHATQEELDSAEFTEALDELVFECAVCGWWCPVDEMVEGGNENVCLDCEDG